MNYFIADLHFGHKNAMAYDHRPVSTIEENDNLLITNWNNRVNIDDDVYILGDISWYNVTKTIEIFNMLNGNKHLIIGNHDKKFLKCKEFRDIFIEILDYKELYIDDKVSIILCHYPIPCFKNHYINWYHFYGHVHTTAEDDLMETVRNKIIIELNKPCNMINVGCMKKYMEYTPKTFNELKKICDSENLFSRENIEGE